MEVVPRFEELLHGSGVIFVQDTVQSIDLHQRQVKAHIPHFKSSMPTYIKPRKMTFSRLSTNTQETGEKKDGRKDKKVV